MAAIKSKIELTYDARNKKSGFIVIEISNWTYEPSKGRYVAKVNDYVLKQVVENEELKSMKLLINSKQVFYAKAQIDALFYLLQNPIELTESYSDEMDNLISLALLYVTQQDPVYGVAENWELVI